MNEYVWIDKEQAKKIHESVISETGGLFGLRDENLLKSALDRPRNLSAHDNPDVFRLAASYADAIVRNRPFVDGNKRTAHRVADVFLEFNGYQLNQERDNEQEKIFIESASGGISHDELAEFYRENCQPLDRETTRQEHPENEAERYRLSPEEHERIFREEIVPDLTQGLESVDHPNAVILGGQPGAGKTSLQDAASHELSLRSGVLGIVGDDLRDYHPEYDDLLLKDDTTAAFYTDRDSGLWVEKLIAYAREQRYNLVIEGTMRLPDKVTQTMQNLRNAGYHIDVRVIAVDKQMSTLGIYQRYEGMIEKRGYGRFTVQSSHDAAYEGMPKTIEMIEQDKLADRVGVYARGNVLLYENTLQDGEWERDPAARKVVETERNRGWTQKEKTHYANGCKSVMEKMQHRGAPVAEMEQTGKKLTTDVWKASNLLDVNSHHETIF